MFELAASSVVNCVQGLFTKALSQQRVSAYDIIISTYQK